MKTDLIPQVKQLIDEVEKTHRYSMSRIYQLHNRVFDTDETPQSCASCLIRKVKELTKWYAENIQEPIGSVQPEKKKKITKNKKSTK